MNKYYYEALASILGDNSTYEFEKTEAMARYIVNNLERPGGAGTGMLPAILSLPRSSAEQMAELLSLIYFGIKDDTVKKRFAGALRKELCMAHEELRELANRYPSSWQNMPRKYMWLTPQITIGKVKFENRFEVRQFYPKGEMYPED